MKDISLLILSAALQSSPVFAATNLVIYADRFENGFEDRSWVTRNVTNTTPVHSGEFSIAVSSATNWAGLYFFHPDFDSTPYESITFWAHGGAKGGQEIQVQGLLDGKTPSDDTYSRFDLATNWQQCTVTLDDLDVVGKTNFTGFWIQETPSSADDSFYVDDVQLNLKPVAPAVVPEKMPSAKIEVPPPMKAESLPAPTKVELPPITNSNYDWKSNGIFFGIISALVVIIALLGCLVLLFWRRGTNDGRATRSTNALAAPNENISLVTAENWKQRALDAEAMAGKQGQLLREKIMPEVTEFAKQSLVQGLFAQRNALLETQQKAQAALAQLESQLTSLHLPLQERIRAYEKRITELEREVETQGEEMRELTRATLVLVRKKLEDEKELSRISGNRFN